MQISDFPFPFLNSLNAVSPSALFFLFWRACCEQERPPASWPGEKYNHKYISWNNFQHSSLKEAIHCRRFISTVLRNFYSIFLTHFLLFWRFTQKFFFQFFKIVSHTLCYKSFEKICTKQLWSKKSTKNWQICQLLWENPQKNLFL